MIIDSLKSVLYTISKPILKRVEKFNGIHNGESCYIFGEGVSIKSMDLALFSDKASIACNYFLFHNNFDAVNCLYCVVNAPFFFVPLLGGYDLNSKKTLYMMSQHYIKKIRDSSDIDFFIDLSNYPLVRGKNVYHMFRNIPDPNLTANFIGSQISCFTTVLRAAIMMAIYMGFNEIYLVGCDYTHNPARSMHWYENGNGNCLPNKDFEINRLFFCIAKEFIDITTITLDGTSDYLNSVTYKEYTGHDPVYKENIELIDKRYLKTLATFQGYSI